MHPRQALPALAAMTVLVGCGGKSTSGPSTTPSKPGAGAAMVPKRPSSATAMMGGGKKVDFTDPATVRRLDKWLTKTEAEIGHAGVDVSCRAGTPTTATCVVTDAASGATEQIAVTYEPKSDRLSYAPANPGT